MWEASMPRHGTVLETNIFKLMNVDELFEIPAVGFKVLARIPQQSLHGLAKQISGAIRKEFRVFAFPYVSRKGDYIFILGTDINVKEIERSSRSVLWSVVKEVEKKVRDMGTNFVIKLLYEMINNILVYKYGYYKVVKSYISTNYKIQEGNLMRYRLYEGFYIKILKGMRPEEFYIALDPTRTLTHDTPLINYIRQGIIERWKGSGMLAVYTREDGIKVIRYGTIKEIDLNITISNHRVPTPIHAIEKCGYNVTLKEYYKCVLGARESDYMDDNEPVVFLGEHSYPPRVLFPIIRTEDLRSERKEIKRIYFLTPEERLSTTKRIRDLISTIKVYNIPEIKLSDTPLKCRLNTIHPPKLFIGNNETIDPVLTDNIEYRKKLLNKLRKFGPYSRSGFRNGDILFLFKRRQGVSEKMISRLYEDLRSTAELDFKIVLPAVPKIMELSDVNEDILKERKKDIALIFVMLSSKNDEDYFSLKRLFNKLGIPSQMLTPEILDYYYSDRKIKGLYINIKRNLLVGALSKAGVIPWILKDKLYADLYVGYDIGHIPSREHPCIASLTFIDKQGKYISTGYVRLGAQRKFSSKWSSETFSLIEDAFRQAIKKAEEINDKKVNSVVIHKDGEVYPDDILVFKGLAMKLKLKIAIVSVKKSKGYRLYRKTQDRVEGSFTGDYVILDNSRALIVTMGYGFIKQGSPQPLLVELLYTDSELNYTIRKALEDIYKLSFIHWQVVTSKIKLPATIAYADEWAYLGMKGIELTDMPPL